MYRESQRNVVIINNTVYFESDKEFEDFSIAPFTTIKIDEKSGIPYINDGDYSDLYKLYLADGKSFVIMDEDSVVYNDKCATKRVPVMYDGEPTGRDYPVQLPVKNLEPWFDDMLMPEDLSPKERDAIDKLINENSQITYQQIAEILNTSDEEALGIFKWWQKEGIIKEKKNLL